jgi:hypothetical protein
MNRNTADVTRSAGAPAYYMGRPAAVWQRAVRTRSRAGARPAVDRTTGEIGLAGPPGVLS